MNLFDDLKWRGLIKDISNEDVIKDMLNNKKITFYWGTDPTADSLHIGHYSSLIMAKRLANYGHHPILLVGGATGLIGDPRPTSERDIISKETVNNNIAGIKKQVQGIVNKAKVVNNYDWLSGMNMVDFLRDVGKYINVNYMLDKDIISRRLESGITFAEFTYTLMQGYDFYHLNQKHDCVLQVAGSDQWGNITTGIELTRKLSGKEVYAFTMPLILDASGKKFGKSEGNALWLDINRTSSYELYQYLINSDDSMVFDYLKIYTFLSHEEILDIMDKHNLEPHKRIAQKTLAKCIITDLHGENEYNHALKVSEALFSGNICDLSVNDIMDGFKGVPCSTISESMNLLDLLVNSSIASSKREAREFLSNNAISVNGNIVTDSDMIIDKNAMIGGSVCVIRKGKKKYYLIKFI